MEQYTNDCTEEQTKRAFLLGAPLQFCKEDTYMQMGIWYTSDRKVVYNTDDYEKYYIPTTQQMIGWLSEQNQNVSIDYNNVRGELFVGKVNGKVIKICQTRLEAELASIVAALDNLEKRREDKLL